jgi:hypothetical protein
LDVLDRLNARAIVRDSALNPGSTGPGGECDRLTDWERGRERKLIAPAKQAGVGRYVIVSSMGANPDATGDDTFSV